MGTPKGTQLPDLTRGQQNAAVPRARVMGPPVPGAGSHFLFGDPSTCPPGLGGSSPHHSWPPLNEELQPAGSASPLAVGDAWERPPHG